MIALNVAIGLILIGFLVHLVLCSRSPNRAWLSSKHTYEGFPLFLRRPTNVDTPINRKRYPTLVVITHEFAKRCCDGRPEPDYNETLFGFDEEITSSFDSPPRGVPVLVETFGGKRHYYFCVALETDVPSAVLSVMHNYPNEKLTWAVHSESGWQFLDRYAREFFNC